MKRQLTKREKVMLAALAVLLVGLVYYKFFLTPVNDKITSIDSMLQSDQTEMDTLAPQLAKYNQMKSELADIKQSADSKPIPDFDNSQKVMDELHIIMAGASSYTLNFTGTTVNQSIVSRPIMMTFATGTYAQAREIIDRLYASDYTNQISDLAYSTGEDGVQVNLAITYYELSK